MGGIVLKAISLKQPWATLIAEGYKTIETRKWATNYRGEILICASKNIDKEAMKYFTGLFGLINPENCPTGVAVCVAELFDCKKMKKEHEVQSLCEVYAKAYSFFLCGIKEIKPIPVKGQLGIFDIEIQENEIIYI